MHRNFNVVLPLADLILGTLMVRSKVKFRSSHRPTGPDVQPMGKEMALVPAESDSELPASKVWIGPAPPHSNHYLAVETFNGCHDEAFNLRD